MDRRSGQPVVYISFVIRCGWTPPDPLAVIAPADGRVLSVGEAALPPELNLPEGGWRCISIFMNVFDVHVNRSPIAGRVVDSHYVKGAFVNASLDKANIDNERLALIFKTHHASVPKIGCVQIAGLVARRFCDVDVGDKLAAGQVYGLIRFGSRVDIWLPASIDARTARTLAGDYLSQIASYSKTGQPKQCRNCYEERANKQWRRQKSASSAEENS